MILTEKTALNLGVQVGDTIYVETPGGERAPVTLTGIAENYMFTRLYVSHARLQALLGGVPEWNTVYGLTNCKNDAEYNELRTKLLECNYIFREIELLSLIGSGVGLLLGIPLHKFIILTVEMDQLMFIRTIAPRSYLLSVALTMLFTFVVCFMMRRHVKHISMVESMKAPE